MPEGQLKRGMSMKKLFYISFFLLAWQMAGSAQNISNKGKDFWAAFGHHLQMEVRAWFPSDSLKLVFDFSADKAAHVVVTIEGTTYRQEYDVPANSVLTSKKIPLPPNRENGSVYDTWLYSRSPSWPNGTNSEGVFKNKGIHITSDVPIVVFERLYFAYSSAATMLFPTDSWGYHYKCLAAPQNFVAGEGGFAGAFSYFYVVASQNNTKFRINPSVPSRSGLPANVPIDVVLQKGEAYQFLGGQRDVSTMHSVTGTTITSMANSAGECLPFAVFVGSSATSASCPGTAITGSLEHLLQQVFPQQAWGKRYFTIPTSPSGSANTRNTNTFRVMVKDPATVVTRNGIPLTGLTASGMYEYTSNTADVIEGSLPIQVAQYLPSQVNTCGYTGNSDPDYMVLSPVEQGIKNASFMRTSVDNIEYNYLALTIPTAGLASLKIDGALNNYSDSYPHPSVPGYSVVSRMWFVRSNTDKRPPAQCTVESDSAFNAFTYGLGQAETYMYNAGTYINNLNGYPSIKNTYNTSDTANLYTCANTPVELSVLLRYKPTKIFWQLSKLADTILPAADVTLVSPVHDSVFQLNNLPYYRYRLPGTYTFNRAGTYNVRVFATEPTVEQCDQTEQIIYQVEVRDTLHTDFSLLMQNCRATETVQFNGRSKFNDSTLIQRWEWSFKNGANIATAQGQNVSFTFNAGNNSASLTAVDFAGCVADTTKLFTLSDKPATPVFAAGSSARCVNNAIQFSETAPQAGVQRWVWVYGNGKADTLLTNGNTTTHTYAQNGPVTVKHVVKYSDNCISDTAMQTITVFANPALSMSYPAGCLPANGVVNFTSTANTPDNQGMQAYLWNFGDPDANASNPNTATIANPSHIYKGGNYTVSLKATTANGCITDSSWGIQLDALPVIQYGPVLTPVCLNTVSPVSVATAAVTNGLTGTGIYKGTGTDATGNFNPATATVGNHTIRYVFTSAKGCTDSAAATIWVHALPVNSFLVKDSGCLNQSVTFTNQSTIDQSVDANAKIITWTWNFGDGRGDTILANGLPFNKWFTESKTYTVSLSTKTADGCISNPVSKNFTVHAVPVTDFSLPSGICMPGGQAVFTNKTAIPDNSPLSYQWNFGDGTNSTDVNGAHTYATVRAYTVSLKATSSHGCTSDTSLVLPASAFVNKPVADFTVSNIKPCEGAVVNFTDKSTAAGSLAIWEWGFGDGTTSTIQNPTKAYAGYASRMVSLVVKDNRGCISDTSKKPLTVYANPNLGMSYPVGCLPENGVVNFTSTVTTPDSQPVQAYLWNFGDPAANASNPNTSTIANPSHKYTAGSYTVTLKATTVNGCMADSAWNIRLHPRPQIQYGPVLTPVCLNTAAPVSVATASITNGVAGTGIYTGAGTTGQGSFNPASANIGNHTIRYVFTSDNGCKDSAAASIWVHAVPTALYTSPADICLDQAATFTNQSTIDNAVDANARIAAWTWNFGDGNADEVKTNGQPFNKIFTTPKSYTVTLSTTSTDGCKSTTFSKTIAVHALPVADFSLPSGICMPDGQATFTNKSSIAEQTTLTYAWNFGDGSSSTAQNPSHSYKAVQNYTVGLSATSFFGCSADTSYVLSAAAFVARPVVAFDVSSDKPCEGSILNFTDRSTSAGNIVSWDWSFGDGTKSAVQNPSKTYSKFGSYTVRLLVTDNKGCSSDANAAGRMVQVRINPQISAGPDITGEENSAVVLKATASNASELLFSWQPAGLLNNPALLQPTYMVKQDQVFVLTATDKEGICSATDEMKVMVLRDVTAPNAFSPNGDGINDVWVIRNLVDYANASVKIFDRYGKQVFVSQGYSKPWDGTIGGKPVPSGTYYYIIHVKQGETPLNGSVTLLR